MKVTIIVNAESKVQLVKELQNVVENISRFNRFDPKRKFLQGNVTVEAEGVFAKYAVVDCNDEFISFHDDRKSANEAAGDDHSVINMKKVWE